MLSKEKLFNYFKNQQIRWYALLDSSGNKIATNSGDNTNDLFEELKEILSDFPEGKYTLIAKRTPTDKADRELHWKFSNYETEILQGTVKEKVFDFEKMEKEIEARVQKTLTEFQKAKELAEREFELKEKLEKIDTLAGQASMLLESVFKILIPKVAPQLQGLFAPQMQTVPLQGTPTQEQNPNTDTMQKQEVTPEQEQKILQAIGILLKHFTPEEILNTAIEIDKNPKMIKAFL